MARSYSLPETEEEERERTIIAIAAEKQIMFHTYLRTLCLWGGLCQSGRDDTLPVPRFLTMTTTSMLNCLSYSKGTGAQAISRRTENIGKHEPEGLTQ